MEGPTRAHFPIRTPLSPRGGQPEIRFQAIRGSLVDLRGRLRRRVEEVECELAGLSERDSCLPRAAAIIDELIRGARREIAVIESSLRRMANHEFDCCMACGGTIPLEQLTLFPYAVNCEKCSAGFPLGYADKLHVQHLQIRHSLKTLSELIESVVVGCALGEALGPDWAVALIVLEDLKRDLPEHFALEERDGHMVSAIAVAPRFHRNAAQLIAQHADFCDRLTLLLSHAREAGTSFQSWARVQQDFFRLSADLLEHERAENDLISRAYNEDIGTPG